nr:hypothetical protein [Microbacterium ulmi]
MIGAAEWAAAAGLAVPVAGRLTPQMSETADELVARGAWFGRLEPYLGIPWRLLAQHGHWLVGDGFSGQFRLAATVLRPRTVTFLDDGANTLALGDALLGRRAFARPDVAEKGLTTTFAPFAMETVLRRARGGRVEFFTAFDLGTERRVALRDRGFSLRQHEFAWTRASARPATNLGDRVVLGSARPVDGRMTLDAYLEWLSAVARDRVVSYLPHRRETDAQLAAVAAVPRVEVVPSHLPVELVLAGAQGPLDVVTLPSSTTTTLSLVLGAGATVNGRAVRATAARIRSAEASERRAQA